MHRCVFLQNIAPFIIRVRMRVHLLGQRLWGVQENRQTCWWERAGESCLSPVTLCSPANLAITSYFQPTWDKGTNALIIFRGAESSGSYCKSQLDMRLSNYPCTWATAKVETSCRQSLTADFLAITASTENTHVHAWSTWICKQTGTCTNTTLLTSGDECAVLSNEPVIRATRGS